MLPQHGEIKSIQVWFVGSHVVSVTLQKRESHFSSVVEVWFFHWEACKQKCDRNHALCFESRFFVGAIILAVGAHGKGLFCPASRRHEFILLRHAKKKLSGGFPRSELGKRLSDKVKGKRRDQIRDDSYPYVLLKKYAYTRCTDDDAWPTIYSPGIRTTRVYAILADCCDW